VNSSPSESLHNIGAMQPSIQDQLSSRVYHAPGVELKYVGFSALEVGEAAALLKYQPAICNRDVLDIGVGAGRTTLYLAQLSRSYLGIDYSPVMIECFKKRFPDVPVRRADMRDLSFLSSETIDFALASANVFDAVSHEHRLLVLHELFRVMRSEGVLLFSSHNRSYEAALSGPRLRKSRSPCTQALYLLQYFRSQFNHMRTGKMRRFEQTYALLDDIGHDYRLLHYYIDRAAQAAQLAQCGFELLDVYSSSGCRLSGSDQAAESPYLHYVARKR